jgi:hypothetical protein
MLRRKTLLILIGLLAATYSALPLEIFAAEQQIRMIEANAQNTDAGLLEKSTHVDRKQIDIEEGYVYVSHSVKVISANPKDPDSGQWSITDGAIKGEDGRVEAVWVEVQAHNKGFFGSPTRVRAQLTVVVEELNEEHGKGEGSPAASKGAAKQ